MRKNVKTSYVFREYPKMVFRGTQATIVNNASMEAELGWASGGADVKSPVIINYKEALASSRREKEKAKHDAEKVSRGRKSVTHNPDDYLTRQVIPEE